MWLTTWHSALLPHIPGHGSLHFWLIHAKWLAHSLLLIHSGLQLGGAPMYSGKQEQEGLSPDALHWEYGPHGVGWHGFTGGNVGGGATGTKTFFIKLCSSGKCSYPMLLQKSMYLRIGWHLVKGSPVKPDIQLQIGLWLITWHLALTPQVPGQGSRHLWLEQAWFRLQSVLTTHSGLQAGGDPIYPGTQEHTACPLTSRHWLNGPQGDGLHGCVLISSVKHN